MKHRAIALTVVSLSALCEVCTGRTFVEFRAVDDTEDDFYGSPCPHCWWGAPIAHPPIRTDIPRSAA